MKRNMSNLDRIIRVVVAALFALTCELLSLPSGRRGRRSSPLADGRSSTPIF